MKCSDDLVAGIAAGVVAGLAAAFIMEGFQQIWSTAASAMTLADADPDASEPATVKAADRIARLCVGTDIPNPYREIAGAVMHYGLGGAVGGLYGAAAEIAPGIAVGHGSFYGGALWLGLDEGLLPAAGLAKSWNTTPTHIHAFAFFSHLVFGLVLEETRRRLRDSSSRSHDG